MTRVTRGARTRIRLAAEELAHLDREVARLASYLEREAVLREATRILTKEFGFDCAWLAEHADGDSVIIRHESGMISTAFHDLALHRGWGLGGKVFALGKVKWVDSYLSSRKITHHYDDEIRSEQLQRIIGAPINVDGQLVGVLLGGGREGATFGTRAANVVETVAERTAQALLVAEQAQRRATAAVQEERQRMALDLHDSVGAMLFAITAGVQSVAETTSDAALQGRLAAIEAQAREAATTLRESLRALQTPSEQLALGVALDGAIRAFESRCGINAKLLMLDVLPPLSERAVRTLIATAKEGLLNVEKHASATDVVVTVACTQGGVCLAVTDNGEGIEEQGEVVHPADHGFGLRAIEQALRDVDGSLNVSVNPDGGTTLRAWVAA
jgi:LuxR family transcriptional regulator, regulator of acetate metabolism